ncbi:MAG: hypothetical protein NTV28_04085 [Propionibacteriales bacterium]|nr:hypothetical protein [Propionibacteriales bacterium]
MIVTKRRRTTLPSLASGLVEVLRAHPVVWLVVGGLVLAVNVVPDYADLLDDHRPEEGDLVLSMQAGEPPFTQVVVAADADWDAFPADEQTPDACGPRVRDWFEDNALRFRHTRYLVQFSSTAEGGTAKQGLRHLRLEGEGESADGTEVSVTVQCSSAGQTAYVPLYGTTDAVGEPLDTESCPEGPTTCTGDRRPLSLNLDAGEVLDGDLQLAGRAGFRGTLAVDLADGRLAAQTQQVEIPPGATTTLQVAPGVGGGPAVMECAYIDARDLETQGTPDWFGCTASDIPRLARSARR